MQMFSGKAWSSDLDQTLSFVSYIVNFMLKFCKSFPLTEVIRYFPLFISLRNVHVFSDSFSLPPGGLYSKLQ